MTMAAVDPHIAATVAKPVFAVPSSTPLEPVTGVGAMLELALALAFVLAVILAIAWLTRRMRSAYSANGPVQVIAEVSLGQKERAILVQVDGRRLLLGVASGAVSLLHSADATEVAQPADPTDMAGGVRAPNFAALLRRSLGRP
jgi:flagellar protein FliO/FliZ